MGGVVAAVIEELIDLIAFLIVGVLKFPLDCSITVIVDLAQQVSPIIVSIAVRASHRSIFVVVDLGEHISPVVVFVDIFMALLVGIVGLADQISLIIQIVIRPLELKLTKNNSMFLVSCL